MNMYLAPKVYDDSVLSQCGAKAWAKLSEGNEDQY